MDLLIQTAKSAYVVEVKRQKEIGAEVENQVETAIRRLHVRKGVVVHPVLVYAGALDGEVSGNGYFDALIPFGKLARFPT